MSVHDRARLAALGWDDWFADRFAGLWADGLIPARVVADHGSGQVVHTGGETLPAQLDSRLRSASRRRTDPILPTIGDWVGVRRAGSQAFVEALLERRTAFRRKTAGPVSSEQVVAANVDVAFVVASLGAQLNLRRIERYLATARSSGARPALLLSKADLLDGASDGGPVAQAEGIAPDAVVLPVSAATGLGIERVAELLPPGRTAVLLGPSGVGKSTLVNRLAGQALMKTATIRLDGKGRHTTSHRQLFVMPWGGLLIDTPGLRELQLWTDEGDDDPFDGLFADVDELAATCRFSDCSHDSEPGCAVRAAIAAGDLAAGRLGSYRKLRRESEAVGRRAARRREHEAGLGRRRRIARLREDELSDWGA